MLNTSQKHLIQQVERNWEKMVVCACYILGVQTPNPEEMKKQVIYDLTNDWENMAKSLKTYFKCETDEELNEKIFNINEETTNFYYTHIVNTQNAHNN